MDRVRVKFGADRGHYGTVIHCGGDDGTYYGVKLDCNAEPVGYSEYELDAASDRPERALWKRDSGADGSGCYVPREVAICPECEGELAARCIEHEVATGRPIATGIEVDCMNDLRDGKAGHRWYQSDWQPVRDVIAKWCDARIDFGN